ncbi:MAG: AbrB/MazE/SpoVT family DNA-binding domain-containing protein [Betaproteobacteria bacterium]
MRHTIKVKRCIIEPTAKIFTTGRSQAVRLPLEYRFDVPEVFIRHDPLTGDVVLSRKPGNWQGLLDAVALNASEDMLIERRQNSSRRDPFEAGKK